MTAYPILSTASIIATYMPIKDRAFHASLGFAPMHTATDSKKHITPYLAELQQLVSIPPRSLIDIKPITKSLLPNYKPYLQKKLPQYIIGTLPTLNWHIRVQPSKPITFCEQYPTLYNIYLTLRHYWD